MGYAIYNDTETEINSLDYWKDFIAKGRNRVSRPCANNTTVRMENENIIFKLHATDIVTLYANGEIMLNSGGWHTVTTKERINRYTSARIYSRKGIWYMADGSLFYDGMVLNKLGKPKKRKSSTRYENKLVKIKKQARAYSKAYVQALKDGLVDYPNGGDCWSCLGMTDDPSHILLHMEESYFVPSLLVNAGRDAGYRDEQIGLMGIGGHRLFIDPENNLYRYIVKQLQHTLDQKVGA